MTLRNLAFLVALITPLAAALAQSPPCPPGCDECVPGGGLCKYLFGSKEKDAQMKRAMDQESKRQERAQQQAQQEDTARFKCMKDAYALPLGTAEASVSSLHCPYATSRLTVSGNAVTQYVFSWSYQATYLYFDERGLFRKELF
jgi:hypothetical protein